MTQECDDDRRSLFSLGNTVSENPITLSTIICLIVIATIIFERITHVISGISARRGVHFEALVNQTYKELMLLGTVSFILTLFKQSSGGSASAFGRRLDDTLFEFADLLLFFVGIFYILFIVCSLSLLRVIVRSWEVAGNNSLLELESKYLETRRILYRISGNALPLSRALKWFLPSYWRYSSARHLHRLSIIRHFFLVENSELLRTMSESPDVDSSRFDFTRYLRKQSRLVVLEVLEISIIAWILVLALMLLNIARVELLGQSHSNDGGALTLVLLVGYGTLALSLVVWIVVRLAFARYCSHLMVNYLRQPRERVRSFSQFSKGSTSELTASLLQERLCCHDEAELAASRQYSGPGDDYFRPERLAKFQGVLEMRRYFPFGNPRLIKVSTQICILFQCFYLSLFVLYIAAQVLERYPASTIPVLFLFATFPCFITTLVLFPQTISIFAVLSSVHDLSKPAVIRSTLQSKPIPNSE